MLTTNKRPSQQWKRENRVSVTERLPGVTGKDLLLFGRDILAGTDS